MFRQRSNVMKRVLAALAVLFVLGPAHAAAEACAIGSYRLADGAFVDYRAGR
jgi:hypothetical protein